jgi:hypothetical protein
MGEKTSEYPFGYGNCQCGCGKTTKLIGDTHLKFFHSLHNPKVRKTLMSARQRAKEVKLSIERSRSPGLFDSPERPSINRPNVQDVAKEQQNERLSHAVAWTKANKDFIKWHRKKLRSKSNETTKRYQRERRRRDPIFKLLTYLRGRIHTALKRKKVVKTSRTEQLIGCSILELKNHLEAQFRDGMSWDNYGQWHVDHIKPCCSFDLSRPEEQKTCFHHTNLQPLWAEENFKKSGRS